MNINIPNQPIIIYCKENNFFAKIAAHNLKTNKVAMVWGNTILLHGVRKIDFLKNPDWLLHEARHILQVRQYGIFRFYMLYMLYSLRYGYFNNPFEKDARDSECALELLPQIVVL